jgi:CubicO group peptidase (beta-lactamase class C family)
MADEALDRDALTRLDEAMAAHEARADGPEAVAWLVSRGDQVHVGTAGDAARDTIFRISSMTKPITAVAALTLVDEGAVALDEPVDRWLPELADRRVLRQPGGPLDDTVPAARAITVDDLLTFRLGLGFDFTGAPQSVMAALGEQGMGIGPPAPAHVPPPDEWMRRIGAVPLERQPGERWLYHIGSEVLGVLIERAAGQPLDAVLRERILEPLGMADTGFSVPAEERHRFGAVHGVDPATGERSVYDPPDGQWSSRPAFLSGGGGLVSTLDDFHAFARMLLAGGAPVLSSGLVKAMTTDQLTEAQRVESGPSSDGSEGWGYGVGVQVRPDDLGASVGTYGWTGGLGTFWGNDPVKGLIAILLTDQMMTSPAPPPVCLDFFAAAHAAA